jgi:tripeptidyl-peptidase-1
VLLPGYPDISVLAHNYVITIGGNFTAVSGTSASAPVFAAFISLVNSERLKNGQPSLGWINPALYALSPSFVKDVTDGDNHCVAIGAICCSQGFSAVEGW